MTRQKFGISPSPRIAQQLDDLVEECVDLGASRSEIVEAVLTAYFDTGEDRTATTRELVVRLRKSRQKDV
jgi:metal-responsive CopG/Arc/MetJ family transcriptional regulator